MIPKNYFIAGTDTGVGKTLLTCALLAHAHARGVRAIGMKPVAAGCRITPHGLRNDDAEALQRASSGAPPYEDINPCALPEPLSPHLAAQRMGTSIATDPILSAWRRLSAHADLVLIEGAGGWLAPISDTASMADLACAFGVPVILIVGLRLGCLNHAQLTARAIAADGLPLAGWIGSVIDADMACVDDNVRTLTRRIAAPCLGVLPWLGADQRSQISERVRLP